MSTSGHAPACLVLAHLGDEAALRIHVAVEARLGRGASRIVSAEALALAPSWVHRLESGRASGCVQLADGTQLDGEQIGVVLNRLRFVPMPHWAASAEGDRDYAVAEMSALWASWLAGLPCPVVDPPPSGVLVARPRTLVERLAEAGRAGFAVRRACLTTDSRLVRGRGLVPPDPLGSGALSARMVLGRGPALLLEPLPPARERLLVVGERVVGWRAAELAAPARELARRLGRSVLELALAEDVQGRPRVADVNDWPALASPADAALVAELLVAQVDAPRARAAS